MDRKIREKTISFLLGELNDADRESFETEIALDDSLFYFTVDLENELVDRYVANTLNADLMLRFEGSLSEFPTRAAKIKNAAALAEIAQDSRPVAPFEPIGNSLYSRFFSFSFGKMRSAAVSILVIGLAIAATLLLLENRESTATIAELNRRLDTIGQNASIPDQDRTAELTMQLEKEQEENEKQDRELAELREKLDQPAKPAPTAVGPEVRGVTFDTERRIREINDLKATDSTSKSWTSAAISVPSGLEASSLSVKLNGTTIETGITPSQTSQGKWIVIVRIDDAQLLRGENKLTVHETSGKEIGSYILKTIDQP